MHVQVEGLASLQLRGLEWTEPALILQQQNIQGTLVYVCLPPALPP